MSTGLLKLELAKGLRVDIEHFFHLFEFFLLLSVVFHEHLLLLIELFAESIALALELLLQSLVLLGQSEHFSVQHLLIIHSLRHVESQDSGLPKRVPIVKELNRTLPKL